MLVAGSLMILEPLFVLAKLLLQLINGVHKILTRTFTTKALRYKAINPAQPILGLAFVTSCLCG